MNQKDCYNMNRIVRVRDLHLAMRLWSYQVPNAPVVCRPLHDLHLS